MTGEEYILKVHKNHRIIIPKDIMKKYDIKPGDFIRMKALQSFDPHDSTWSPTLVLTPMKVVPKSDSQVSS